ncbi:MAG TPA: penicillin-binding protein 1C [Planctomycetota bacterium]|nr:penicillin-binding protein 1C [Planctomycetota bacterium]
MLHRLKRGKWLRRAAKASIACVPLIPLAYTVLSCAFPFPMEKLEAARQSGQATLALDRRGGTLCAFSGRDQFWMFDASIDDFSPRLIEATVAAEDARFRSHPGVDPLAMIRAAWQNAANMRTVSGASTISMQSIRLLECRPRTLVSKIVEAFRAVQLERLLTKDEILECYLNLAPYGGNIVGAEAASMCYFGKRSRDLTLAEAALLAGLPQSPARLRPDRYPERARVRRDYVLARMLDCELITRDEYEHAIAEPVRVSRRPLVFNAPHFSQMTRDANPGKTILHTTLDRRIQHLCEIALRESVAALHRTGLDGSIVVIENKTAAVRALVGSRDFLACDAGQVNGAIARRSPGSALKPFTYALAFERGICTPGTMLADVPCNYAGYAPENYDHLYRGPVPAGEALARSLNAPAIRVLDGVGQANLHEFLQRLGLTTLTKAPGHYGLGLTLGSADVKLLELTNAYATLARLGVHRPCRLLERDKTSRSPGRRVLSQEAAYLVAEALSDPRRLSDSGLAPSRGSRLRVAWKTGTSWGHRDAWTFAYTPEFTVGVWLGDFSGKPVHGLAGTDAAAPIAIRVLRQIGGLQAWYAKPERVLPVEICVVSGMPIGENCGAGVFGLCIAGRTATQRCTVHAAAMIDGETGGMLCESCAGGRHYERKVVECWPSEMAQWLRHNQPGRPLAPPHFDGCSRRQTFALQSALSARPKIMSPQDGNTYILMDDAAGEQKLLLQAVVATEKLYWFVDGSLHAAGAPSDQMLWPISRGVHQLTCCDDAGRSASVTIEVK